MPTLTVPAEFPVGLGRGAENGQAADAVPVEAIERAIAHLCGGRKLSVPLWCVPRTVGTPYTFNLRVERQPWTRRATLSLIYYTATAWDRWALSLTDGVDTWTVAIQPSPGASVAEAVEVALPFNLGANSESEAGAVNLTATLTFKWRDSAFVGVVAQELTLLSAFLQVDPVGQIVGT